MKEKERNGKKVESMLKTANALTGEAHAKKSGNRFMKREETNGRQIAPFSSKREAYGEAGGPIGGSSEQESSCSSG